MIEIKQKETDSMNDLYALNGKDRVLFVDLTLKLEMILIFYSIRCNSKDTVFINEYR